MPVENLAASVDVIDTVVTDFFQKLLDGQMNCCYSNNKTSNLSFYISICVRINKWDTTG